MDKCLKLISILLDYPSAKVQEALPSFEAFLSLNNTLSSKSKYKINKFIKNFCHMSLIEWEQIYTHIFDYTPSASLYMFDHIYGDSKQRGMAMVNLKMMYEDEGLILTNSELPDYLPVYLDFLGSTKDSVTSRDYLAEVVEVLNELHKNLSKAESPYALLVEVLIKEYASKGTASYYKDTGPSDAIQMACSGCNLHQSGINIDN
ncbi:MAG: nitrate reductase molybdenum cofactor assembly chaperone [Bacteroidales bacterium]